MPNGTGVTSSNGNCIIDSGLRADVMRKLMETKNTLQHAGSLYVGTGQSTQEGASGDLVTVYKTQELLIGDSEGKVLSVNHNHDGLEYRHIGDVSFGGFTACDNWLKTHTALINATGVPGSASEVTITANGKLVYVEHATSATTANSAYSAQSAQSALTADSATVAENIQMNISGEANPTNTKFYTKTFTSFSTFKTDASIKGTIVGGGAIIQASYITSGGVQPVMIVQGDLNEESSYNAAYVFAVSSTPQWRPLVTADFANGEALRVVYVR